MATRIKYANEIEVKRGIKRIKLMQGNSLYSLALDIGISEFPLRRLLNEKIATQKTIKIIDYYFEKKYSSLDKR